MGQALICMLYQTHTTYGARYVPPVVRRACCVPYIPMFMQRIIHREVLAAFGNYIKSPVVIVDDH